MRPLNPTTTISPSLLSAIRELAAKVGFSQDNIARAVAELSQQFTKERSLLNRPYLSDPARAVAYLNYFLPVNLCKVQVLLDEMPPVASTERFSVLDLGSGPGTGALAVLDWWYRCKHAGALSITAVDNTRTALYQAEQLWERYCLGMGITTAKLQTYEADVERIDRLDRIRMHAPFDLIILSNCLNELSVSVEAKGGLVASMLSFLALHGTVMIVEPALRETSRALHQVRDRLLQEKRCTVYSPCLHGNGCPALVNPDDWCHEERAWEPPAVIKQIDDKVGFIKDALKFSYLLLRKDDRTIIERGPDVFRVVSELREMKGEKRAWLCNELGRQEVGRQDRLASPRNDAFDRWHRGAIVQIDQIVRKEKRGKVSALGRIERDAAVELIRPA